MPSVVGDLGEIVERQQGLHGSGPFSTVCTICATVSLALMFRKLLALTAQVHLLRLGNGVLLPATITAAGDQFRHGSRITNGENSSRE
jgi:hypothetical protein